jgi:hypothetical protein
MESLPSPPSAHSVVHRSAAGLPCARRPRLLAVQRVKAGCPLAVMARFLSPPIKPSHAVHLARTHLLRRSPCCPPAPLEAAMANLGSDRPFFPQLKRLPPSLAPVVALRLVHASHRAATSLDWQSQPPPPPVAGAPTRRQLLSPTKPTKRTLVGPRPLPCSPPAGLRRTLTGFEAGPPMSALGDPIARVDFFLRVNLQSRGIFVSS